MEEKSGGEKTKQSVQSNEVSLRAKHETVKRIQPGHFTTHFSCKIDSKELQWWMPALFGELGLEGVEWNL